jgi:transposase InsO family protein
VRSRSSASRAGASRPTSATRRSAALTRRAERAEAELANMKRVVRAPLLDEGTLPVLAGDDVPDPRRPPRRGPRAPQPAHPPARTTSPNGSPSGRTSCVLGCQQAQGPGEVDYYYLYVMLDVFSRYIVGWAAQYRENGQLARAPIEQAAEDQARGETAPCGRRLSWRPRWLRVHTPTRRQVPLRRRRPTRSSPIPRITSCKLLQAIRVEAELSGALEMAPAAEEQRKPTHDARRSCIPRGTSIS